MSERRKRLRNRCFLGARVVFNGRNSTLSCVIRNHCEDGALLKFGETPYIPQHVEIVLDNRDTLMPATVVWRGVDTVGIAFPRGRFMSELKEDAARTLATLERPAAGMLVH